VSTEINALSGACRGCVKQLKSLVLRPWLSSRPRDLLHSRAESVRSAA